MIVIQRHTHNAAEVFRRCDSGGGRKVPSFSFLFVPAAITFSMVLTGIRIDIPFDSNGDGDGETAWMK
jgi:hypothetical protein